MRKALLVSRLRRWLIPTLVVIGVVVAVLGSGQTRPATAEPAQPADLRTGSISIHTGDDARAIPLLAVLPAAHRAVQADSGFVIENQAVIQSCGGCHVRDSEGRMGRLSYLRKTPEGWQTSIRRMVALHGVQLEPTAAREVVRYLATYQGLAPEELEPGRFEVEKRMTPFRYSDEATETTCSACHSMGRVITVRRTAEEWELLVATHRALYPLVDRQAFFEDDTDGEDHPVEKAISHLAEAFPLETPEWQAWSANLRPARIEGTWALSGHQPGRGLVTGTVEIGAVAGSTDEFETRTRILYPADGMTSERTGLGIVYTGYQWRGRTQGASASDELREVMTVSRGRDEITGRWFTGPHDEFGLDVTLRRVGEAPVITGVFPASIRSGTAEQTVQLYGANLPAGLTPGMIDLGPGIDVLAVEGAGSESATLRLRATADAPLGARDVFVGGGSLPAALVVHDGVDRIAVTPELGLARVGGIVVPKQYQQFEAWGFNDGPDGEPDTADDIPVGLVPVSWRMDEFPVTYDDDDVDFVGAVDGNGLFTPAVDGPNPERSRNRNNIGEVWIVARYEDPAAPGAVLEARSHLIIAPPVHLRWENGDGSMPIAEPENGR